METFGFTLRLNRTVNDDEVEALYEAGLDDAGLEIGALGAWADFDREAPSLVAAVVSAVRDIEEVPGLRAIALEHDAAERGLEHLLRSASRRPTA